MKTPHILKRAFIEHYGFPAGDVNGFVGRRDKEHWKNPGSAGNPNYQPMYVISPVGRERALGYREAVELFTYGYGRRLTIQKEHAHELACLAGHCFDQNYAAFFSSDRSGQQPPFAGLMIARMHEAKLGFRDYNFEIGSAENLPPDTIVISNRPASQRSKAHSAAFKDLMRPDCVVPIGKILIELNFYMTAIDPSGNVNVNNTF